MPSLKTIYVLNNAAAKLCLSPPDYIGEKLMALKKAFLAIIGLASETYPMTFLLLSLWSGILAAWQDFGFGLNIFAAVALAEYAVGWLAHKRRGTWTRKAASEGVVTIGVQFIVLSLVQYCRVSAGIATHIAAYMAFFWALTSGKTLLRNAAYLGVPAIPGLLDTMDWLMARLSKLLIPVERLEEDDRRRAMLAGKAEAGTVDTLIAGRGGEKPAGVA